MHKAESTSLHWLSFRANPYSHSCWQEHPGRSLDLALILSRSNLLLVILSTMKYLCRLWFFLKAISGCLSSTSSIHSRSMAHTGFRLFSSQFQLMCHPTYQNTHFTAHADPHSNLLALFLPLRNVSYRVINIIHEKVLMKRPVHGTSSVSPSGQYRGRACVRAYVHFLRARQNIVRTCLHACKWSCPFW